MLEIPAGARRAMHRAILLPTLLIAPWPIAAGAAETPSSGVDLRYIDQGVRPQDDFYRYVNGKWLATAEIPADKGVYGSFYALRDTVQEQLHTLVEGMAQKVDPADADQAKIRDLYASFMDEARLETLGLKPLDAEFAAIDAVNGRSAVPALVAHLQRIGVTVPFGAGVHLDAKDTSRYVYDLGQDGLGMPDRDYYLKDDPQLATIRGQYQAHIARMRVLAGDTEADAASTAKSILALETALAKVQWTKVENRDPVKTYNKVPFDELPRLAPAFGWKAYLDDAGVSGRTDYVVVSQPTYLAAFGRLLDETPLPVWKAYFRWHLLSDYAPYLSAAFVDEHFRFYGKELRGIPQNRARWKRGLDLVSGSIGEGLGRSYVARYFPAQAKARMDQLVRNLLAAYRADIDTLDWMGPETRRKALAKLARFTTKIGYPDKWRDYSALRVVADDLVGNVARARAFEAEREVHKLGQPVDRSEWAMTPQTVNAYYEPEMNEIVFPAAILQPPFFNADADDAVNYGAIGGVIGHEISHGFDDEGSQYDGEGKLLDPPGWFTAEDLARFKAKTRALVQQYAAYAPVPGYPINGELTLGENIADNSGLAIAYKAYHLALGGHEAPVLDGLTGDQRFFVGWATVWRSKSRDKDAIVRIKSDPHSPGEFRGLLPEMNQAPFLAAFGVKPGDKMYLPPEKRVSIW